MLPLSETFQSPVPPSITGELLQFLQTQRVSLAPFLKIGQAHYQLFPRYPTIAVLKFWPHQVQQLSKLVLTFFQHLFLKIVLPRFHQVLKMKPRLQRQNFIHCAHLVLIRYLYQLQPFFHLQPAQLVHLTSTSRITICPRLFRHKILQPAPSPQFLALQRVVQPLSIRNQNIQFQLLKLHLRAVHNF